MKNNYINAEQMTNAMVNTTMKLPDFKVEWHTCEHYIKDARKSGNISLPCKSVSGGSVVQLSRVKMYQFEEYWRDRQRAIETLMSADETQECKDECKADMYLL